MIPELGQFALILALLLALVQGTLPLVGAARGNRALDGARAARRAAAQFLFVALAFGCLAYVVRHQRLLGAERRQQFELEAAAALPLRGDLGLARRLAAAVDADARRAGRSR